LLDAASSFSSTTALAAAAALNVAIVVIVVVRRRRRAQAPPEAPRHFLLAVQNPSHVLGGHVHGTRGLRPAREVRDRLVRLGVELLDGRLRRFATAASLRRHRQRACLSSQRTTGIQTSRGFRGTTSGGNALAVSFSLLLGTEAAPTAATAAAPAAIVLRRRGSRDLAERGEEMAVTHSG
jgi:hypothetical protein